MRKIQATSLLRSSATVLTVLCGIALSGCALSDLEADDTIKPVAMSAQYPIKTANGRTLVRPCGNWSANLADTASNETPSNMGCAVQYNIAALLAHPNDINGRRRPPLVDGDMAVTAVKKLELPK